MDSQEIRYAVQDRVATVTLYRPGKLNAFTRRMRDEVRLRVCAPRFGMKTSADMPSFYPWWEERPFK